MKLHNHLGIGVQLKMYIYSWELQIPKKWPVIFIFLGNGHSTTVQTPPGLAYDNSLHFFAGT